MLRLVRKALKKNGAFYASFKYGNEERDKNGRVFSDFTEDSVRTLLEEAGHECLPVGQGAIENRALAAVWLRHLEEALARLGIRPA